MVTITEGVEFNVVAREWRCKWSADNDKESLVALQTIAALVKPQLEALDGVQSVTRIVCGGCLDFKIIVALDHEKYGAWGDATHIPEESVLKQMESIPGVTNIETQTYTWMPATADVNQAAKVCGDDAVTICAGVEFNVIGREWRCKWSEDNDKQSLRAAQAVMTKYLLAISTVPGVIGVQRIVCGGCKDFKIIAAVKVSAHEAWEQQTYAPGPDLKAELASIDGITCVEDQTYTLMCL